MFNLQQLVDALEWVGVILTVALGLARIGLSVWKYLDHGHPDIRRDWVSRAVELAVLAQGDVDSLLHVGPGTPIEAQVCRGLARRAETYLADHGVHLSLDSETVRMVLNDLRQAPPTSPPAGVGFQPPPKA